MMKKINLNYGLVQWETRTQAGTSIKTKVVFLEQEQAPELKISLGKIFIDLTS